MLTIGASHSVAARRHFSRGTMSLSDVEYSRIRPQPVHVRLQVCSGSSCKAIANFGVLRSLCLMMWPAIFADRARGNRIGLSGLSQLFGRLRFEHHGGGCEQGRNRWRIGLHQAGQEEIERGNALL